VKTELDPMIDEVLPQRFGFWKRNQKGTLWRRIGRTWLTVFERQPGRFAWCISSDDNGAGPRFSPKNYKSEELACRACETEWEDTDE
jgi:hypothetical protein